VEVLERAAELLPHVAYVHNNLGVALERVGRGDEAKTAYQRAMDLSPKYVKARLNAARVAKVIVPETPVEEPDAPTDDIPMDVHPSPEP
jgi:predicted RNA polymerase sigma factor